jgi:transglutaminase-like putative cysteine protease
MRTFGATWCGLLVVVLAARSAEPPPDKISHDIWEAAYLGNAKVGFVHTSVRQDDQKILHTIKELNLTVRRNDDTASIRAEVGTDETESGSVVGVFMKYYLAKGLAMVVRGTVEDGMLHVQSDPDSKGPQLDKRIPWNNRVVGLYRQDRIFKERRVKPGDQFAYLSYEPEVTNVVTTRVSVKDFEEVPIGPGKRQRLLRVEAAADKIADVVLPPLTLWLDQKLEPVRSETDIPGLGKITFVRTTRQEALRPGGPLAQKIPDIGRDQLISLNRRIIQPYDKVTAVYRITSKGDDDPATLFARDGRQTIKRLGSKSCELEVRARAVPEETAPAPEVKEEYLKSCYFITSDDPLVQKHARQAVGQAQDPWEMAKRIEHWVHVHMENKNFSEAFAPASHVAKTLEGDCTEHAMLTAAMCRAVGVPSRAAVGLIYVDHRTRGPVMGFHMWTEVYIHGQWVPIDATLGRGFVGASHIKISDHSWYETQSLTPLLPTVRVLSSKIGIEVVRANGAE